MRLTPNGRLEKRFRSLALRGRRAMSDLPALRCKAGTALHSRPGKQLFRCPITNHPCEGDLAYLCEDYGCARKGGLSPHSDENQ